MWPNPPWHTTTTPTTILLLTFSPIFRFNDNEYKQWNDKKHICVLWKWVFFPHRLDLSFRKHYFKEVNLLIRFCWLIWLFVYLKVFIPLFELVPQCSHRKYGQSITSDKLILIEWEEKLRKPIKLKRKNNIQLKARFYYRNGQSWENKRAISCKMSIFTPAQNIVGKFQFRNVMHSIPIQ